MTWLARLSVANRAIVGLVTVLVIAFGVVSTTSLRQELLPSLDLPIVSVVTPYPGASPDVVEQQVTTPVEDAVASLRGVTGTSSTSTGNSSVVRLDLAYGTDLTEFATQAERAVQGVRLPADLTSTVVSGSTDSLPVVQLAVSSDLPPDQVASVLRDQVQPLLAGLPGVADVSLSGIVDPRITIDLDPAAAASRGVAPTAITSLLQQNGVRVPAGQLTPDTSPLTVEVGSPITSVAQLGDLYVTSTRGAPVRLGDIAAITEAPAPATGYTRTDGAPSIGIGVTKQEDANTVAVSHAVSDALPQVVDALGGSARSAAATVVFDQAPFIEQSVEDLTTEGLLGLLFAVLVILGFLLSVRATLVTAVSIPLSVLIAMIVLYVGDYTLNILTLGALTVAIGRVVDDSIVVIENIKRHLGYGGPRRAAILTAVREVAGAITASTITTVAVFAPIGLVGGQVGELFRPFAVTVTAALLASLLVSLTVVPVLASLLLRSPATPEPEPAADAEPVRTRLQRGYLPVLHAAIRRPVIALGVAVAILAGTVALVPLLQTNFLGDAGGDTLSVSQELAPGTGLPEADAAAKRVEQVLGDTAGVASYQVTVGSPDGASGRFGFPGGSGGTATRFSVTLADDADATAVADSLRDRLASLGTSDQVGTLTVQAGQGASGGDQLAVDVRAEDPAVLAQAADQVQRAVAAIPGASDVRNDLAAAQPVVDVAVDRQRAAAAGLTEAQIGQVVATALRGSTVGTLTIDGVDQDVLLRTGDAPADVDGLRALPLAGRGAPITLGDVATVTQNSTAPSITHTDGSRSAQITARPAADDLGAVTADLRTTLDGLTLPPGATAEIGGVSQQQSDAFAQLGLALLVAIAVVYLVMVITFRSLLQPLLLLVAIPFAATGALGLLLLTGTPLGVPALIGMLMLIGIVVTNAIVLIDLVNQYRRSGRSLADAVTEGAAQRLRPILMTAVATIFALLPMAFGLTGGGGFISQPLAVVVIGGLVSSTLLTLVLVPVLYVLVERVRGRRRPDGEQAAVPGAGPDGGPGGGSATPAVPPAAPAAVPSREPVLTGPGVRGVIADRDGIALAGAAITVFDGRGTRIAATVSAEGGRYAVPLPGPGEYVLVGQHEGREPTADWVQIGAEPAGHDLRVEGPASIAGQVRHAAGAGVPAIVTVVDQTGELLSGTRGDATGHYLMIHIPPGEHHLLVSPPNGASTSQRVSVPLSGTLRHDVVLPPTGMLAGTVRSRRGHAVSDAIATVTDGAGAVVATGRTAADGSFRLSGLPEGIYTVTATVGAPAVTAVRVRDGSVTSADLELGEQPPGEHTGNGHR
ncbi:efflux RND transporter permease subunit [Pseudonocardia xinjiangensis]|uniref:efflux RND transporter permease subunit n=1 Tax=Pseudonocardia xinjiangensis TaxID=75289 RepID=UPI003D8C7BBB